jgi:hypothetical protein
LFDDLIRRLQAIPAQQTISLDIEVDDEGYWDRACPAPECGASFKVIIDDWKEKVPDEQAWCPVCGEVDDPREFNTPDQTEQINAAATAHIAGQLDEAFRSARKPALKTGFVSMSWSYRPGDRPLVVMAEAQPLMTYRSSCESCGCRYASVGAAFFCPACGHNNAKSTFAGSISSIRALMDLADRMPSVILDVDAAKDASRQLTESTFVRVWSSFQRLAEATYTSMAASATVPARRNAFQSLEESDRLWAGAIGKTYLDFIGDRLHHDLVRLVQARHVLAHKDGIVDADYVAKSGDSRYAVGQRLVISADEVRLFTSVVERLADELHTSVAKNGAQA